MAHYALLSAENVVTTVIAGVDEGTDGIDWEEFYGNLYNCACKRTSYNTFRGKHVNGGIPYRMNFAAVGFTYDEQRDAFIPPQPYASWLLDESTLSWHPPVPRPDDASLYEWNEEAGDWTAIEIPIPDDYDPATDPLMIEWLANNQNADEALNGAASVTP